MLSTIETEGVVFFFFFKQKTAYEIVSRDWSSDVCSSDLSTNELHLSSLVQFIEIPLSYSELCGNYAQIYVIIP